MFYGTPPIVTNGLVLNLDCGNRLSYPTSGTTWTDLSGNNNNGTLTNGPTFNPNNLGSIVFDGVDDIAIIQKGLDYPYPYPYSTYEMWIKTSGIASGMTYGGLFALDYGRLVLIKSGGTIQYVQQSGPSTVLVNTSVTPTNANLFDNQFHQIVCLRNTTTAEIYIDGVIQKTVNNGGNPSWDGLNTWSNTMNARLSADPNNTTFLRFQGYIAITRMYNRGLTSTEVLQNYNAYKTRFGLT